MWRSEGLLPPLKTCFHCRSGKSIYKLRCSLFTCPSIQRDARGHFTVPALRNLHSPFRAVDDTAVAKLFALVDATPEKSGWPHGDSTFNIGHPSAPASGVLPFNSFPQTPNTYNSPHPAEPLPFDGSGAAGSAEGAESNAASPAQKQNVLFRLPYARNGMSPLVLTPYGGDLK